MHVHWMPVVSDLNAPTHEKLSYKALSSPIQLRTLQTEYNTFLRSYGYKLERGELDSKRTHSKQQKEKYDIELKKTKKQMAELEKTKIEIEQIEKSSKEASEYSSKEFTRAIQGKQDKITKLENQIKEKDKEINRINNANKSYEDKVETLTNYQRYALDRQNEISIIKEFIYKDPVALEVMNPCIKNIKEMHEKGKELIEHKSGYDECLDYKLKCEKEIADIGAKIGDSECLFNELDRIGKELPALRAELPLKQEQRESLNQGFSNKFKVKDKKALDVEIAELTEKIVQREKVLFGVHGLRTFRSIDISDKMTVYKEAVQQYKTKQSELTVEAEQKLTEAITHRKSYIKIAVTVKSESQDYQETISRYDGDYISPIKKRQNDLDINNLTADERKQLKAELPENCQAWEFVKEQEPKSRKMLKQFNIKSNDKPLSFAERSAAAIEISKSKNEQNEKTQEKKEFIQAL